MAVPIMDLLIRALALFLLANSSSFLVSADNLISEEGYTVTTVIDGNNLKINPHSVLPQPGSSDLIILDSVGNALYTASLPTSKGEIVIKRFAGNGSAGFADGDFGSVMFDKPRSFAVDSKGNVYVADKKNFAIRKISRSGVTTIAGGFSKKAGSQDGPGCDALFSDDLELAFFPEICALMISDHGNKLVRKVNLKSEDCARGSQSVVGVPLAWSIGLVVSCLLGLIVGYIIHPYITSHEGFGFGRLQFSVIWKHCLISLERLVQMLCFDSRSAVANTCALCGRLITLSLSHISLMFGLNLVDSRPQPLSEKSVSLIDSDLCSSETTKSLVLDDVVKDLVSLDGCFVSDSSSSIAEQGYMEERRDVSSKKYGTIDDMMQANVMDFVKQAGKTLLAESTDSSPSLVKRR